MLQMCSNNEKAAKILIDFLSTKFLFNHTVLCVKVSNLKIVVLQGRERSWKINKHTQSEQFQDAGFPSVCNKKD